MIIELVSNYGLFLLKTLTIVISILFIISYSRSSKDKESDGNFEIKNINKDLDAIEENIKKRLLPQQLLLLLD